MKVKVRIAVAVAPDGEWEAVGGIHLDAIESMGRACEDLSYGPARYWLTANLDIPETQEVAATVERG